MLLLVYLGVMLTVMIAAASMTVFAVLFFCKIKENRYVKRLKVADIVKPIICAVISITFMVYVISFIAIQSEEVVTEELVRNTHEIVPLYTYDSDGNPTLSDKYVGRSKNATELFYEKSDGEIGTMKLKNETVALNLYTDGTMHCVEEIVSKETVYRHFSFWRLKDEDEKIVTEYIVRVPNGAVLCKSEF